MFLLSGWQSVMLLQELFGAQISDPNSQQKHQQAYRHPDDPVCDQQGVQWDRQQGEEIDGAVNHHGDCKVVGAPIDPGQQGADDKRCWPGNGGVSQGKENR